MVVDFFNDKFIYFVLGLFAKYVADFVTNAYKEHKTNQGFYDDVEIQKSVIVDSLYTVILSLYAMAENSKGNVPAFITEKYGESKVKNALRVSLITIPQQTHLSISSWLEPEYGYLLDFSQRKTILKLKFTFDEMNDLLSSLRVKTSGLSNPLKGEIKNPNNFEGEKEIFRNLKSLLNISLSLYSDFDRVGARKGFPFYSDTNIDDFYLNAEIGAEFYNKVFERIGITGCCYEDIRGLRFKTN